MKTLTNIVRKLCRPAALAALGLTLLSQSSQAATIKFEVKVPGYTGKGNGWALVVKGAPAAMVWHPELNCYVTDRAARGEKIRVTLSPSTALERCQSGGLAGAYSDLGSLGWAIVPLPFTFTGTVPTNPMQDNVYIWCATSSGFFERRIPIGGR